MNDERREDLIADVRRYLGGKRSSGISSVHRISGQSVRSATDRNVDAEPAEGRREGPAGDRRPAASVVEEREIPTGGEKSIRYRQAAVGAHQGSLFGGDEQGETLDLAACDLDALDTIVSSCTRCPLHEGRARTVFGSGPPTARLVFIGEAPGRDEDMQGVPFVGRAGKLLTKILASVGLSRDEVYITNILKCRPPGNRDPREDEVTACEPYLRRQIELLNPVLICALGRVAGQNLLRRNASLSVLRQNIHYYNDTKVFVTYHPAALLRNPGLKKGAWEDIQAIRALYDEEAGGG